MRTIKGFSDLRKKKKKEEVDMKLAYNVKKILKDECQAEGNSQMKDL